MLADFITASKRGPACSVTRLPADVRAEFDELLADDTVTASMICRALLTDPRTAAMRPTLSSETIRRHRGGFCRCNG